MQYRSSFCCSQNKENAIFHFCSKRKLYWIFASLRILLTFIPQTGYIHPDEYFQYIEVASGDTFDIDVYKPWEFNVTFPVRNSLFPQLCVKFPYVILKGLNLLSQHFFDISLKSPYFLILFPRLMMTILSFISDYCLYKICLILHESYINKLTIFASSYVMLVHCTRTFSNSVEMILTSILLYCVSRCVVLSNKVVLQSDYLAEKYCRAQNGVERTRIYKLRMTLPSHSWNDCFLLATITVLGIFNRPTFLAFALPPIFFWLFRGLGSKSVGFLHFHVRIFLLSISVIPSVAALILHDSLYFGYLTTGEIAKLQISINNFVVTPLNFLKYNSQTSNLKNHGLHPRFLHVLVNVPLLFNVLGIIAIIKLLKMINSALRGKWLELPRVQSLKCLMMSCFITPVAMLSIFPHQEPRFIIPVLLPLTFLFAHYIKDPSDAATVNIPSSDQKIPKPKKTYRNKLKIIWYLSNFILVLFYGFVHQGGVLPLTRHLYKELKSKPFLAHVHLLTSHTYSLPTSLLHLRNTNRMYRSDSGHKYKLTKDLHINQLGSTDVEFLYNSIVLTIEKCESKLEMQGIPYRLYYALPSSFYKEFMNYVTLNVYNDTNPFEIHLAETFYPHLSVEKPPKLDNFFNCFNSFKNCLFNSADNLSDNIANYFKQFQLLLLRIKYTTNVS